ncbi:MAG: hypothetical protein IJW54_04590 [Clostridia bacterium]|nr:hypothetical protein [Clostridia bacterium]
MKKRILILIMAILCLSLVFVFASCGGGGGDNGDGGETCQHTYGEWEVLNEKTCVSSGLQKRVCSSCGGEETETIPAGHTFGEWTTVEEPTCEEDGTKRRVCSACGNPETDIIVTSGHTKNVTVEAKAPTETEDGCTEASTCSVCGDVISESLILPAYKNIAKADKVTVISGEDWPSFSNNKNYLFDGDIATAPYAPKGNYKLAIELNEDAYILDITVVCNGGGKAYDAWVPHDEADTARISSITVSCFKDGKLVATQSVEDATTIKEVKIENIGAEIDAIEIDVKAVEAYMWGNAYIWEINARGTYPQTVCEANGHSWGEWNETKAPVCTDENELTDGEKERACSVCGETEKEKVKAEHTFTDWGKTASGKPFITVQPACGVEGEQGRECTKCYYAEYQKLPMTQSHNWGEWVTEGNCTDGGTKTRQCINEDCGMKETIQSAAGEHIDVVTEGYKAPTTEEDGATGKTYCKVCGEVISTSKVITKLVNHSSTATASSSAWVITPNYMNDGDMNTGVTGYGNSTRDTTNTLTWSSAVSVNKIVIYFSGDTTDKQLGKNIDDNYSGIYNNTNPDTTLKVMVYGADGKNILAVAIPTKDSTEYTITFEEVTQITKIEVINTQEWNASKCVNVWEVEALNGGEVTDTEICEHDWSDWSETRSAACGVDGLKERSCTNCGDIEEEVIPAPTQHVWSKWSNSEGFSCTEGGTRERTCTNEGCGVKDTQTVEAGEHIELVTEGAKEPTFEEEGSTGATKCTACGATVTEAKVITKLANVAIGGTVTTDSGFWASTATNIQKIIDGNRETGVCSNSSARSISDTITLKEASNVNKVILVVNGKGSTTEGKNYTEITNKDYTISFVLYDESGNVVFTSEAYNTLDKIEIAVDIDLAEGVTVKSVTVKREKMDYDNSLYLWEVEVLSGGEIVE